MSQEEMIRGCEETCTGIGCLGAVVAGVLGLFFLFGGGAVLVVVLAMALAGMGIFLGVLMRDFEVPHDKPKLKFRRPAIPV